MACQASLLRLQRVPRLINMANSASATYSTERLYYKDTKLQRCFTRVLAKGSDHRGSYVVLDRSVFHPQGGGQPLDEGQLWIRTEKAFPILDVQQDGPALKHYLPAEATETLQLGIQVEQELDLSKRLTFAQLHTAGHALADAVAARVPGMDAVKGNHFPGGQAYVVFRGADITDKAAFTKEIEQDLADMIAQKKQIIIDNATSPRTMQIEGFAAIPCGGTHLNDLGELIAITIRSIRKSKGEIKVGYDVV